MRAAAGRSPGRARAGCELRESCLAGAFVILVWHILDAARKRLALLSHEALVPDAAKILANANTPLVVVCDKDGRQVGVISRTDIIKLLAQAGAEACTTNASTIMTRSVVSCHVDQPLQQVWTAMNSR